MQAFPKAVFLLYYACEFTCWMEVGSGSIWGTLSLRSKLLQNTPAPHSDFRYRWAACHAYASPLTGDNSGTVIWCDWKTGMWKKAVSGQSDKALCFPNVFLAASDSCLGTLFKLTLETLYLLAPNEWGGELGEESVSSLSYVNLRFSSSCTAQLHRTSFYWRNHLSDLNK